MREKTPRSLIGLVVLALVVASCSDSQGSTSDAGDLVDDQSTDPDQPVSPRCVVPDPGDADSYLESELTEDTVRCMFRLESDEAVITRRVMEAFLEAEIGLGDDAAFPSRIWLDIDDKAFIPLGGGRAALVAEGIDQDTSMTAAVYLRYIDIVFGNNDGTTTLGELQLQLYTNQDIIPNTREIGAEDVKDDNHWIHHREWWANERTFDYVATLAGLAQSPLRDQTMTAEAIGALIGGEAPSEALEATLVSWGVPRGLARLSGHEYGDNRTACDGCEYSRETEVIDCFCSVMDLLATLDEDIHGSVGDIGMPSSDGGSCTPASTLSDADALRLVDVTTSYPDAPDGVLTRFELLEFLDAVINFVPNALPGLNCSTADPVEQCASVQDACDYCPLMPVDDLCAIVEAQVASPEFEVQTRIIPFADGDWLD